MHYAATMLKLPSVNLLILHDQETWPLILWMNKIEVCENKLLRRTLGPKREVTGAMKTLNNNLLQDL
jgi:hypothetical protein